jgi:hypothetical protein
MRERVSKRRGPCLTCLWVWGVHPDERARGDWREVKTYDDFEHAHFHVLEDGG